MQMLCTVASCIVAAAVGPIKPEAFFLWEGQGGLFIVLRSFTQIASKDHDHYRPMFIA
jgi:hypothetical protein